MKDNACEQEIDCVTQYVVLLLGIDDDPIPSMIHLDKELFVLTESAPHLKGIIKFSASINGPHCEVIYECIKRASGYSNGLFKLGNGIQFNSRRKKRIRKLLE